MSADPMDDLRAALSQALLAAERWVREGGASTLVDRGEAALRTDADDRCWCPACAVLRRLPLRPPEEHPDGEDH